MILKMEKLVLYALSENKMEILDKLMGLRCVQIIPPQTLEGYDGLAALASRDAPKTYEYEQKLSEITAALGVLLEYEPKAGLFSKKAALEYDRLLNLEDIDEALKAAAGVKGIVQNIAEVKSFQSADLFLRQSLVPWQGLDIPLEGMETKTSRVMLYTLPRETDMEALKSQAAQQCCWLEIVSSDADLHYVAAAALKTMADTVLDFMKQAGGLLVTLPQMNGTPAQNIAAIDGRDEQYQENHKILIENLQKQAQDTALLKRAHDQLSTAIGEQRAKQHLLLTKEAFVVAGWVAEPDKPRVEKALAGYTCHYAFTPPTPEEDPPVRFKNNKLVEPFEVVTEMYGLPNPHSLDPDPLIAPFFFLFFGMMLSDAGYGLILLIAGYFGAKLMQKGGMGEKLLKMISICGISTIIWGAIYGGWFGDIITVFARDFLGKEVSIPLLIDPLKDPMLIMILSFAFGLVHILVGMAVKAWLLIKRGHPWIALFDVGFWFMVILGLVGLLVGALTAIPVLTKVGAAAAIAGAVGLICTQGREKKSLFSKFFSGLYSLYDITSYFSDILSYSRILALGLATGVIASVVNILSTLVGPNIIGAVVFLLVFVFGHLLNLAINALGAYVHTSRLQYVEFFGKFYEGGGRPFTPFRPFTKYYLVQTKEEN